MKDSVAVLIPARLESSRFPEKMLAILDGKPLVTHVFDKCVESGYETYVLSESDKIRDVIPEKNFILTSENHENGTSRCMEVINGVLHHDYFINVQGDMPDITKDIIDSVYTRLKTPGVDVATAYTKMPIELRKDPNSVKLIHNGFFSHWFCRASLEYGDHHLGVYGYSKYSKSLYEVAKKFREEEIEKLEQLRWLQNGIKIFVTEVEFDGIEINTVEDLKKWKENNVV